MFDPKKVLHLLDKLVLESAAQDKQFFRSRKIVFRDRSSSNCCSSGSILVHRAWHKRNARGKDWFLNIFMPLASGLAGFTILNLENVQR